MIPFILNSEILACPPGAKHKAASRLCQGFVPHQASAYKSLYLYSRSNLPST